MTSPAREGRVRLPSRGPKPFTVNAGRDLSSLRTALVRDAEPGLRRAARLRSLALVPALVLFLVGAAADVVTGFDGLYGQDSFAYFGYAVGPLRGSLLAAQWPPPFHWPPGFPLPVAVLSLVVGSVPVAGQIVSLVSGAAVPFLTALLAREALLSQPAGQRSTAAVRAYVPLLAGAIVAATGQLLQSSIVVMADTLGLATATAGAWALLRYGRTGMPRWLSLAAAAFAWAIATRWIYGLVAVPFVVAAVLLLRRQPLSRAVAHGAAATALGAVILAPVVLPAMSGLITGSGHPFAGDFVVYSWSPINALQREFATPDGQLSYGQANGLFYGLAPAVWWYFGPLIAAFVPIGLVAIVRGRCGSSVALLVGWWALVLAFHAGAPYQNARFTLAYLPPLAIFAAIGFTELLVAVTPRVRPFVAGYLLIGLAIAGAGSLVLTDRFIERKQADLATVNWVVQQAPQNTQLLTFGITATFQHYSHVETYDLSELNSPQIEQLLSDGQPTMVLIDVANVERQWKGLAPWENYLALRDGLGLITLGRRGAYTLFLVSGRAP